MLRAKRWKVLFYILSVTLFIIFLFFSNTLITFFYNDKFEKIDFPTGLYKDQVDYGFEYLGTSNNITDDLLISGRAIVETKLPSPNKQIVVMLVSEKDTYAYYIPEKDLYAAVDFEGNPYGEKARFKGTLPTINMENGVYSLYIYCQENEENYGLVETGELFKKDNTNFTSYQFKSDAISIKDKLIIPDVANSAVSATIEDGQLKIHGYSVVYDYSTETQKTYISLIDQAGNTTNYTSLQQERSDISQSLKSDKYLRCGFKGAIDLDKVPSGDIILEVLTEIDGNIYTGGRYLCNLSNEKFIIEKIVWQSEETTEIDADAILSGADSALLSEGTDKLVTIYGYGYAMGHSADKQKVYIKVSDKLSGKGTTYTTKPTSRPDIAAVMKDDKYLNCGFSSTLFLDEIPVGDVTVEVLIDVDGNIYTGGKYRCDLSSEKFIIEKIV